MTEQRVHLGISTCPNDTYAFHAIIADRIDTGDLRFDVELLDVQELNRRVMTGDFDIAKVSFCAALQIPEEIVVLPSGSAVGFGVGPVLLAAPGRTYPSHAVAGHDPRVLCPGEWTTAAMLYELFHKDEGRVEHVVFSEIIPALVTGEADFGVCIHEGRFTYRDHGLTLVEDLGETWEARVRLPLPLGGIVGRRKLGQERLTEVQRIIRASIEYADSHREETVETMQRYAQELQEQVLWAHVDLYVNEWTRVLGVEGVRALAALARETGSSRLEVLS